MDRQILWMFRIASGIALVASASGVHSFALWLRYAQVSVVFGTAMAVHQLAMLSTCWGTLAFVFKARTLAWQGGLWGLVGGPRPSDPGVASLWYRGRFVSVAFLMMIGSTAVIAFLP